MASKIFVPDQPLGTQNVSKQKNVQPEVKNRRVLRDIGNLAPNPNNRPAIRRVGVQFLAKTQEAEDKINCKKLQQENEGKDGVARAKAMMKKEESKVRDASSKKTRKSLTAILTARSKAAFELANKPKDIDDIDAADIDNELAAVEYVEDMYNFYKQTEDDGRVHEYIDSQPEINSEIRAILVDWLIEVHRKFQLVPESLYLTVNLVDRFLAAKNVSRRELQLAGISSMLIACKYEEIWAPEVSDFIVISDNAYVREQVLVMEKAILEKVEWYLTVPTPYVFLVRYIKASAPADMEMSNMTFFYAELGLMNYTTIIQYSPSKISASAVYTARRTLERNPLWTETLKHHTGYSEDELMDCAKMLAGLHAGAAEHKLKAVVRKYSNPERGAVALFPPPSCLLPSSV